MKELRIDIEVLNAKFERIRESCVTTQHRKSFNNYRRNYNKMVGEWFSHVIWYIYFPSAFAIGLFIVVILAILFTTSLESIIRYMI